MDAQTLSQCADWLSGIHDTELSVLIDQYGVDPRAADEILTSTARLFNSVDRSTNIQDLIACLRDVEDETWTTIFAQVEGFHHVLVEIVSKNFLCGLSKDDFVGSGASLYKNYAYSLTAFLDTTIRYLSRLLQDCPSPLLQQSAQHTVEELSSVWDRLAQLAPTSSWRGFEPTRDLDRTPIEIPAKCASVMGVAIMLLYIILHRLSITSAFNARLISYIIHAFCLEIPNLNLPDFNKIVTYVLSVPLGQERRAILTQAFCAEVLASMFFKAYCRYLTNRIEQMPSDDEPLPSEDVTLHITQLFHLVVSDGPEPLIHVLSSPGTLEMIISHTLRACQHSRCSGKLEGKFDFAGPFVLTVRAITLPVFKRNHSMRNLFSLDTITCHHLLSYCTLGLSAELESNADCSAVLLDCIAIYALPGAKCNLSLLSTKRQHDIGSLRRIIKMNLRVVRTRLHHMEQDLDLQRRAAFLVRQIADELLLNEMAVIPSQYPGRPHRCCSIVCECSGVKPPHPIRVCKGCFSAFYCNQECQKFDWNTHKDFCRRRASQESTN